MQTIKTAAKKIALQILEPLGHTIAPLPFGGMPCESCENALRAAAQLGLTIPQYYAHTRNEPGEVERLFSYLDTIIPFATHSAIVEIGAGTGRFLEQILHRCHPGGSYEVYETDPGWSEYLEKQYGVTSHSTRGFLLDKTPDSSADLVHADYVFAYLPATTSFRYFKEISRVLKPGGVVFFDAYLDSDCDLNCVNEWLNHSDSFQVILPRRATVDMFEQYDCGFVDDRFVMKVYRGHTRYLIFRKSL